MSQYVECNFIFIKTRTNKYGFKINEDLCVDKIKQNNLN